MEKGNYIYIVECADGTLYTGWSTDPQRRLQQHNNGSGAKYTRNRRPVKLVYTERFESKEEAMKREYAVKQMSRAEKLALIEKSGKPALIEKCGEVCSD